MKLSEKGRFAPPPSLDGAAAQQVSETIAGWDGVHARSHWLLGDEREVDGADFYLGEEELGHIHLDSEAHVMLPRVVAEALIAAGLASRFPWGRGTVAYAIASPGEVEHALWLFGLSYDRRRGASSDELLARVRDRATRVAARDGRHARAS